MKYVSTLALEALVALNAAIEAARAGESGKHGKKVLSMVKQMQELVQNTLNQADKIVQESKTQEEVTKEVEKHFYM